MTLQIDLGAAVPEPTSVADAIKLLRARTLALSLAKIPVDADFSDLVQLDESAFASIVFFDAGNSLPGQKPATVESLAQKFVKSNNIADFIPDRSWLKDGVIKPNQARAIELLGLLIERSSSSQGFTAEECISIQKSLPYMHALYPSWAKKRTNDRVEFNKALEYAEAIAEEHGIELRALLVPTQAEKHAAVRYPLARFLNVDSTEVGKVIERITQKWPYIMLGNYYEDLLFMEIIRALQEAGQENLVAINLQARNFPQVREKCGLEMDRFFVGDNLLHVTPEVKEVQEKCHKNASASLTLLAIMLNGHVNGTKLQDFELKRIQARLPAIMHLHSGVDINWLSDSQYTLESAAQRDQLTQLRTKDLKGAIRYAMGQAAEHNIDLLERVIPAIREDLEGPSKDRMNANSLREKISGSRGKIRIRGVQEKGSASAG